MLKTMTILGTRPDLIKMSRVIAELDYHTNHVLVHTGQNYDYELNEVFFSDLEIRRPDFFLDIKAKNAAQAIAQIIERADELIVAEKPDAILFYGDTNSCLAVIAAKRRQIPVFHMEAGNRCFDQRVPEELNRKVLDHLSDINLVLTEHARRYLIAEGIKPETIIKTGSHMSEVLDHYLPKIKLSNILSKMDISHKNYFVVSVHREENVDPKENLRQILESLNALADAYDFPVIVSTHPRTRKRLEELGEFKSSPKIDFIKPLGFCDYIWLMMNARCTISDSGTITEESALLNIPAITIRNTHERPEGMDVGTLVMSGLDKASVLEAVKVTIGQYSQEKRVFQVPVDYLNKSVSKQIIKIILSYTNYVNRTVWQKF